MWETTEHFVEQFHGVSNVGLKVDQLQHMYEDSMFTAS